MKKVALSLLILALVGASLFGDPSGPKVTAGGKVETGLRATLGSDPTLNTVSLYNNDAGYPGGMADLWWDIASATSGVHLDLRFYELNGGTLNVGQSPQSFVKQAYGWASVGWAKFVGGVVNTSPWAGLDDQNDDFSSNPAVGTVGLELAPVAGLNVGTHYLIPFTPGNSQPVDVVLGAAYTADQVVSLTAQTDLINTAGLHQVSVTGSLLAVPSLTLKGGYSLYNFDIKSGSNLLYDLTVEYQLNEMFDVGVVSYYFAYDKNSGKTFVTNAGTGDPYAYTVKPYVGCKVDSHWTVGTSVKYISGYTISANTIDPKATGLDIEPNVKYTVDPNSSLNLQYDYNTFLQSDYQVMRGLDTFSHMITLDARFLF